MTDTTDQSVEQKTSEASPQDTGAGVTSPNPGQAESSKQGPPESAAGARVELGAAQLNDLAEDRVDSDPVEWDLQMVGDIPVTLSVEVGRNAISIHNLLQLSQGSIVELDRNSGEPLDVLVNGCLVAHGEVVVVNEKFGIRLTDVVSPGERFRKLN